MKMDPGEARTRWRCCSERTSSVRSAHSAVNEEEEENVVAVSFL